MAAAVVCRNRKRSFVDEIQPAYKKSRCSYSPPVQPGPLDQLRSVFPDTEIQLLERALKESGNDLGLAVKRIHGLHLEHVNENAHMDNSSEWVDLIVKEMNCATNIDDAKTRAATVLETLVKSISSRASAQAVEDFRKENSTLKEQNEVLVRENVVLKRAVGIQFERQKENDVQIQELHQLKQLVARYQEQLQSLEMNNYALKLHLNRAQNNNPMPGRLHPDVF
ncbi:Ubiquitin system component Cue protein [Striga hermonthica]|uniref:Ubiquitin system component Cue protein n=1 Tax=Striga hermonthica TaxID=68872 RepID=A0A9N7R7U4_STRHE|nr:Ubiquitin system component Cue protein [Striga hermonthica]